MPRKRKTYTAEFKLQAVRLMTEQGLSVAEVARQLGVSENCLRQWRNAARDQGDQAFPGQGSRSPADDEIRRLRAELRRAEAERDLLKKAATYFASLTS
jgi:transposase